MQPRLSLFTASRLLCIRSKTPATQWRVLKKPPGDFTRRTYGSKDSANVDRSGPNTDQLPHVSEEAAKVAEITGEKGPELEQGTPIEEVRVEV